jgi:hypothetical protein
MLTKQSIRLLVDLGVIRAVSPVVIKLVDVDVIDVLEVTVTTCRIVPADNLAESSNPLVISPAGMPDCEVTALVPAPFR